MTVIADPPRPPAGRTRERHAARGVPRLLRLLWIPGLDGPARAGYLVLSLLVLVSVVGSVTGLGGNPEELAGLRLQPPSTEFALGTDALGRSLLPRVIEGLGTTLTMSMVAVMVTAVLATAAGVVAGYLGGPASLAVLRVVDVLYAFPALVLAILVSALVGFGRVAEVASIVLVTVPLMVRLVRAAALSVSHREYVTSAIISGAGTWRILTRHVLPNVAGTVVVQTTYSLSVAMLVEGGLGFLGLGVQLPGASLGTLIQQGGLYMNTAPWLILAPGAVFVAAVLAVNLLGDGLRDMLEPQEVRKLS